ncbi:hypothetical protein [Haloarcula marina]|uniref:hypothetical protein n=1 Tax=Haloarcula marina TaxID=2961574 RepID=UPI0020B63B0E|nr:hypothetical protein [Halomicroarcula marina]
MTLYPTGGEAASIVLVYVFLGWFVGCLYGGYKWERLNRDRSLHELLDLNDGRLIADGGQETFECDGCADETSTNKRRRYLPPSQPDTGELETEALCPQCSTGKDSARLFRAVNDLGGER